VRLNSNEQVSVLAAVTGLVLIAAYFFGLYFGIEASDRLPDVIACIAGYELFMFSQGQWQAFRRRRAGGGDHG